ncbi:hypothetical protein PR048_029303 [Dryococelus australis]|uniref:Uncharacterized protein n=1 Tax=Dryococelus australis TaxID=614101 RepID=A0ABQ9GFN3_9NEOP|nr:hypothetical protein PR048_029303 [Dryococelus australis]
MKLPIWRRAPPSRRYENQDDSTQNRMAAYRHPIWQPTADEFPLERGEKELHSRSCGTALESQLWNSALVTVVEQRLSLGPLPMLQRGRKKGEIISMGTLEQPASFTRAACVCVSRCARDATLVFPRRLHSPENTTLMILFDVDSLHLLRPASRHVTRASRHVSEGPRWLSGYPARLPPRRSGFDPRPGHFRFSRVGNRAGRCRWSAGFFFLGDLPFPPSFHSGAGPYSCQSPASALKTSMLRDVQISSRNTLDDLKHAASSQLERWTAYKPFEAFEQSRTAVLHEASCADRRIASHASGAVRTIQRCVGAWTHKEQWHFSKVGFKSAHFIANSLHLLVTERACSSHCFICANSAVSQSRGTPSLVHQTSDVRIRITPPGLEPGGRLAVSPLQHRIDSCNKLKSSTYSTTNRLPPRRTGLDSQFVGRGRGAPGFSHVGIVPDDANGWRIFSVISRFPRPRHSGRCSILTSLPPTVGSQDLDFQASNQYQCFLQGVKTPTVARNKLAASLARIIDGGANVGHVRGIIGLLHLLESVAVKIFSTDFTGPVDQHRFSP